MAIYTTNNTPYKGRSLQDMLIPYLMYTQRYDDIANKIGELGDLSVIWNNLLSPTRDNETWTMVNNYNERLGNTIADMLNGNIDLNTAMNRLQNMRREYNSWGTAVDNAYKQRQKFIEEQRALALQPGGYHVTRPAESISIDELMSNPAASYEALSENELYTRGLNAAKAASGRKFSTYQTTRFKGEYEMLVNQKGYTQRDATKFLADKYNIPELGKIFDNLSTEYNLNRFGNSSSIDRIQLDLAIFNGILDGMTGERNEQSLGRRKEPTKPNPFDTSGNKGKSPYQSVGDLHIVEQGSGEPTAKVNTSLAWIDPVTGNLIDTDVIKAISKIDKQKYKQITDLINNGTVEFSKLISSDPDIVSDLRKKFPDAKITSDDLGNTWFSWKTDAKSYFYNQDGSIKEHHGEYGLETAKLIDKNGKKHNVFRDIYPELQKVNSVDIANNNLQQAMNKYSYIAYNPMFGGKYSEADAVNIGRLFDNMTNQPVVMNYSPNFKPSDMKNIINHYQGLLSGPAFSPTIEDSQNGVFVLENDGTLTNRNLNLDELNPATETDILIFNDYGSKSEIGFRQNNKNYALRGNRDTDNVTRNYDLVKQWMLDFTNNNIENPDNPIIIYNSNTETAEQAANGHNGRRIGNTPFYGYILYDQASNDIVKIVSFNRTGREMFMLPEANSYMVDYGSIPVAIHSFNAQRNGNMHYLEQGLNSIIGSEFNRLNSLNE